ncbi:unnamed protein product [Victoria cruziana]
MSTAGMTAAHPAMRRPMAAAPTPARTGVSDGTARRQACHRAPASVLAAAALASHPGRLLKFTPGASATSAAELGVQDAQGDRLVVYVDPYRARVLGALPEGGTVAWTIRRLHSLKYFGRVARGAIEIAAGWAILLVLSGVYLWWPRGRRGGVLSVRGRPGQRLFWRDLHAVTGLFVGAVLLFLALTGMPWSVLWGQQVNQWANGSNFGYPAGVRVQVPMSTQRLSDSQTTAWSLAQARVPQSGHEGHEGHGSGTASTDPIPASIGLDAALAIFERLDLAPGYTVTLPRGASGVYTASVYPSDLSRQRVIHIDQYSGRTLLDMRYADYGPLGRTLEWGINVHLGQEYGALNQWGLALACLAIVLLSPARWGLGVPPPPAERRALRAVVALMVLGGLLFPLVGASTRCGRSPAGCEARPDAHGDRPPAHSRRAAATRSSTRCH